MGRRVRLRRHARRQHHRQLARRGRRARRSRRIVSRHRRPLPQRQFQLEVLRPGRARASDAGSISIGSIMNSPVTLAVRGLVAAVFAAASAFVAAQPAPAPTAARPAQPALAADDWPRDVTLSNAAVLVYQPQINTWDGNQLDFRAALAIKPKGAKDETFGVMFATARTQVDKVA